jgi:hypothetical protein
MRQRLLELEKSIQEGVFARFAGRRCPAGCARIVAERFA